MKVYELIYELSKYPAGAEVSVSDAPDGWLNAIGEVECESDEAVFIRGDGVATKDNEG